jgi:hypothetical protein
MRRSGTGTFSTTLATIRYAQPKPFFTYATRAQKTGAPRPRIDGKGRAFRLEVDFRLPARSRHRRLRLVPMMGRMQSMRVGDVGVMPGLLMIAGFIVLGRFAMMMRGALVVIGGGLVVLATLVRLRAHVAVLLFGCTDGRKTATEV